MKDKTSPRGAWKTDSTKWPELKDKARAMRLKPTDAEAKLWNALRNKATGYKFRRQHSIGLYIVDFYCSELHLAIEIDGPIHLGRAEEDEDRQAFIQSNNIKVLRFTNEEILANLDKVIEKIKSTLPSSPSP